MGETVSRYEVNHQQVDAWANKHFQKSQLSHCDKEKNYRGLQFFVSMQKIGVSTLECKTRNCSHFPHNPYFHLFYFSHSLIVIIIISDL